VFEILLRGINKNIEIRIGSTVGRNSSDQGRCITNDNKVVWGGGVL
jgi:hypothetical protein